MLLPESLKLHDKREFEFHYIYFLPWKDQLVASIVDAGGRVLCMSANQNLSILFKWFVIRRYIKQNKIDLVHAHLPWAGFVSRLVFLTFKIPVIYTEHNKQERYHWATRWLNKITFNWQSGAIAVSQDVRESIQGNIRPSIPVFSILNGVNTYAFVEDREAGKVFRKSKGIPGQAIVVGTVAVFRFQKRLNEWLEVFAKAVEVKPELFGVIVGDGPLRPEVEMQIQRLGLSNKVMLAGLQADVLPWYQAMDVFMMSSVFEGLPVALLEAMSCGCAVITTNAGGIKEVIGNNENGYLVGVEEWPLLVDRLLDLAQSPEKRQKFSDSARSTVVKSFSMHRMVKELESFYHSLLGQPLK